MHNPPSSLMHKVLKLQKLYSFKIHLVQELSEDDIDRRMECRPILMNMCNDNFFEVKNKISSDESTKENP